MERPKYIDWLVEEQGIQINGTHKVKCYRIDYNEDPDVLDDWALHIRRNYISDDELQESAFSNSLSAEDYLKRFIIPQKGEPLGATARSGDIAEILMSDLLEFIMGYTVPRYKQKNRSGKNNSEHGTDVIGYKFYRKDKTPSELDELIATEVKAKLTSEDYSPLSSAIDDSIKDEYRLARTIDYCRKKLKAQNDLDGSNEISRFLLKPDNNYIIQYSALGVSSKSAVDSDIKISIKDEDLKLDNGIALFFIHGERLMKLAHEIYERCNR